MGWISAVLASLLVAWTIAAEPGPGLHCGPRFAEVASTRSYAFSALRREIPGIDDPVSFAEEVRRRRAEWGRLHPQEAHNCPMPEMKTGVDWLKRTLTELRTDPYYRYRDATHHFLSRNTRERRVAQLLRKIRDLETRGYPETDSISVADEVTDFLRGLDRDDLDAKDFLEHLEKSSGLRIDFSKEELARLQESRLKNYSRKAIGEERLQNRRNYEEELIRALETKLAGRDPKVNVRAELRKFQDRWGLSQDPEDNIVKQSLGRRALNSSKVLILTPDEISVRALAEAVLFEIEPIGLVSRPIRADGGVMSPSRFLQHDFNHMNGTLSDPLSKRLVMLPPEEKLRILRDIDGIVDARRRDLAEKALLVALREFPTGSIFAEGSAADQSRRLAGKFKLILDTELSSEEVGWLLEWWKTHLPLSPGNKSR